jgi:lysine 6-dehydrogenase
MRCAVLGAGRIGESVIVTLLRAPITKSICVVDSNVTSLQRLRGRIDDKRVEFQNVDIHDELNIRNALKDCEVVFATLPTRSASYRAVDLCIDMGLSIVDVLEEYHRRPDLWETEGFTPPEEMSPDEYGEWLHEKAKQRDVVLLDGMGFAPGLSNVTMGQGIRKMDEAVSAIARVGGVPAKQFAAQYPLQYMVTWSFAHVLREYMVRVKIILDGKIQEVDALTGYERFAFNEFGRSEELECAVTPGMPSFIYTRPNLHEFAEKTIRWPRHFEQISMLKDCGLLDLEPVSYDGRVLSPRDFVSYLLTSRMQPHVGNHDECIMWNTVRGYRNGGSLRADYFMWDTPDNRAGITSMAKVTGAAAAAGGLLIASGSITARGIVPPEDAITSDNYQLFISMLDENGVHIKEVISEAS